jgi:hypothetical protein
MTYVTLAAMEARLESVPEPRPIAVAFFSKAALKEFLRSPIFEEPEDDDELDGEIDARTAGEPNEGAK